MATPITVAAVSNTVGTMTQISFTVSIEIPLECGAGEDARCGDDDVGMVHGRRYRRRLMGVFLTQAGQLRTDETSSTVTHGAESYLQCKRYDRCIAQVTSLVLVLSNTVCRGNNGFRNFALAAGYRQL